MKNFRLLTLLMLLVSFTAHAGVFQSTGTLNSIRGDHAAVLLTNGQVLVAGGSTGSSVTVQYGEVFNPATDTWTNTGSTINAGAFAMGMVLLTNGQVLLAGGYSANASPPGRLSSAQLFNPLTGLWTNTTSLSPGRYWHTLTMLPDGRALIVGGNSQSSPIYLATSQTYDSVSGSWTTTGSLKTGRFFHAATLLANGKVLVAGGLGATGYLATAELYDPAAGTWAYTGSLATNRHRFSAVLLTNGQVLVMGGFTGPSGSVATATAELYNPATGTWTATGSMLTNRVCQSAKLLTNGQVLVTDGDFNGGKLAELYDPNSGTWSATGPMMASRIICSSTLLPSGKVLVAGGSGFSSSELYDPNSQTWTTITLTNAVAQTNGALQFNFAHATTTTNTVLCATNITLPLSNWTVLGTATETSFGQFQFTDAQATNHPQSFYRVRSP